MIEVTKEQSEVRYILEFGDSQKPERFIFTEAETQLLERKLREVLYGEVRMP